MAARSTQPAACPPSWRSEAHARPPPRPSDSCAPGAGQCGRSRLRWPAPPPSPGSPAGCMSRARTPRRAAGAAIGLWPPGPRGRAPRPLRPAATRPPAAALDGQAARVGRAAARRSGPCCRTWRTASLRPSRRACPAPPRTSAQACPQGECQAALGPSQPCPRRAASTTIATSACCRRAHSVACSWLPPGW